QLVAQPGIGEAGIGEAGIGEAAPGDETHTTSATRGIARIQPDHPEPPDTAAQPQALERLLRGDGVGSLDVAAADQLIFAAATQARAAGLDLAELLPRVRAL